MPPAPFMLDKFRRREVDGNASAVGPAEAAVADGGADALLRFLDGGVWQADDRRGGHLSARDIDFDVDEFAVEPNYRTAQDFGEHGGIVWPARGRVNRGREWEDLLSVPRAYPLVGAHGEITPPAVLARPRDPGVYRWPARSRGSRRDFVRTFGRLQKRMAALRAEWRI